MKPDQERVRSLLVDTVTLLCKNSLNFSSELKVEGLLGITLDNDDIFLVNINEKFGGVEEASRDSGDEANSDISSRDNTNSGDVDKRGLKDRGGESPSGRAVNKSQVINRPSSPNRTHSRSPSEAIRIKQEQHDDVIVVLDPKTEGFSSCARQRRTQMSHGNDNSDTYSGGLELSVESYPNYDQETDGEPPTKRRTLGSDGGGDDSSGNDGFGSFKLETSQGSAWTPPAVNLGAEIAAQMAQAAMAQGDNSLAGLENMPGCSSWSPGQNLGTPSSQPSDMSWMTGIWPHMKKSRQDGENNSEFLCTFPGCDKRFKQKANLYHHFRDNHVLQGAHHRCTVPGCGKSFKLLSSLCHHRKAVHGTVKPSATIH